MRQIKTETTEKLNEETRSRREAQILVTDLMYIVSLNADMEKSTIDTYSKKPY